MAKRKRNHFNLLCDIGEIASLLSETSDIYDFLSRAVELVAKHLDADVCSIYLYDDKEKELVLRATRGLNPSAVGVVKMKPGEGLVGWAFESFTELLEGNAQKNPRFKYFIEADEDDYHSFICVPIRQGVERIGVLTVQRREFDWFDDFDVRALKAAASQLAGSLENIRLLMEIRKVDEPSAQPVEQTIHRVSGTPASPGYAFGPVTVLKKNRSILMFKKADGDKDCCKEDFLLAVERTHHQLKSLEESFVERLPESASLIFTAHFLILRDRSFTGEMENLIDQGMPPMEAVKSVAGTYIGMFRESQHAYMQEKALDVEDLAIRILSNMVHSAEVSDEPIKKVVAAAELFPSDILKLASGEALGIILVGGGIASHVTILSRSLQIPLVIADDKSLLDLEENTPVLVDADQGNIYVNPSEETIRLFENQAAARKSAGARSAWMTDETLTSDGTRVRLLANINLLAEMSTALTLKAEGIGLYRTEFPFLVRSTFPSEAEQYVIYKKLFDTMGNRPVTIRTLDAGGDKALAYSNAPKEENPELGLRSIRFSLMYKEPFENQIRAILRAASGKTTARMMFPLISSVDELIEARSIVSDCMQSLTRDGLEFNAHIATGMMIELPSVIETIDRFAEEVDFFSIGTNDFVQYMLAADRTNKMVSCYYLPHHPSVLRGLHKITSAAKRRGIDVSVCGEMAHDSKYLPFLLGIGVRTLSVDPQFLPDVQSHIARIDMRRADAQAQHMLEQTTVKDVAAILDAERNSYL
jgi:phosphotransferase system enzyme I (PtsP)